jgi:farnesyl-diphosphate farnesyltransferase
LGDLARHQGSAAERELLLRSEESLQLLQHFSRSDRALLQKVLTTIAGGQELDLRRFAGGSSRNVIPLTTDAELEDYTYRVAGCVGEFWTNLCRAHVFPRARLDDELLLRRGIEFGKGLQLINILRDLPADLQKGRCYLPIAALQRHGLVPLDLLQPASESKLRSLYNEYLDRAEAWLKSGWSYTLTLPWQHARVRLACAWPILIGHETLARLRTGAILDSGRRIKITRQEVYGILVKSLFLYPCPPLWRGLFPLNSGGKAVASTPSLP